MRWKLDYGGFQLDFSSLSAISVSPTIANGYLVNDPCSISGSNFNFLIWTPCQLILKLICQGAVTVLWYAYYVKILLCTNKCEPHRCIIEWNYCKVSQDIGNDSLGYFSFYSHWKNLNQWSYGIVHKSFHFHFSISMKR